MWHLIQSRKTERSTQLAGPPEPAATGAKDTNQFLMARREFAGAFGDLARGKRNWQLVSFVLLGLLSVMTLSHVRLAASSRIVPYVVEVDKLGQVTALGPADQWKAPEPRLVAAQLSEFIRNVRTVLPAVAAHAQADLLQRAYTLVEGAAADFLNAYFIDPTHDPRVIGQELTREVQVTSILPIPKSATWKLRWTETDSPIASGVSTRTTAWEGYVTIRLAPPMTVDAIQVNPFGVHITAISWTRITEQGGGMK